jgi:sec-independent protein translocase protein TatB
MFDVGFSELMMIAVVALVVIGPERLPKVARTLGHLFGRLQRYVNDVKADISREMELDELRKFKDEFQETAQSVESGLRNEMAGAESTISSIAHETEATVADLGLEHPAEPVAETPVPAPVDPSIVATADEPPAIERKTAV